MKNEGKNLNKLLTAIKTTDIFFIQLTFLIAVIGLIFALTSSTNESYRLTKNFWSLGLKQIMSFIAGIFALVIFWMIPIKFWYQNVWKLATGISVIMILTVFTGLGKTVGGSQRWIDFGIIQFQPAEIAKFVIILLLSKQLVTHKWYEKESYFYLGCSMFLIAIVLKQPDLGTTLLLLLVVLQLLFIGEWPIWFLIGVSALGGLGCYLKIISTPYQMDRIKFWLNPYLEPLGRGYNHIQAQYALGLGGLFGAGIGNSIQKKGNLPVAHSDFIFAVVGEEVGFIGVTVILILLFTWFLRGIYLLNKVENKFSFYVGYGIMSLMITQALINIAVAIGLFPITGVTLPFFSCGGTSLIISFIMCGILFNIISASKNKQIF